MIVPYKYCGVLQLALLVVVLPFAAWRFALRDTLGAWRDCRQLTARLETLAPVAAQKTAAVVPDRELILSGGLLDTVHRTTGMLSVQVAGYEPLVTEKLEDMTLHTAQLTLAGRYTDLVRVVYALERTLPTCRLRSLAWSVQTDRRTQKTQLTLTLYIQQIALKK